MCLQGMKNDMKTEIEEKNQMKTLELKNTIVEI